MKNKILAVRDNKDFEILDYEDGLFTKNDGRVIINPSTIIAYVELQDVKKALEKYEKDN